MSTAETPIKFRCSNCDKHLGVSRSKAGMLVACPRCKAELVVPEPPPEAIGLADPAEADAGALFRNLVEAKPATAAAPAPVATAEPTPAPFLGLNLDVSAPAPAPAAPPIRTEPAPKAAPAVPTPTPPAAPGFSFAQAEAPAVPIVASFPTIRAEADPVRPEAASPRAAAPSFAERSGPRRNDGRPAEDRRPALVVLDALAGRLRLRRRPAPGPFHLGQGGLTSPRLDQRCVRKSSSAGGLALIETPCGPS